MTLTQRFIALLPAPLAARIDDAISDTTEDKSHDLEEGTTTVTTKLIARDDEGLTVQIDVHLEGENEPVVAEVRWPNDADTWQVIRLV